MNEANAIGGHGLIDVYDVDCEWARDAERIEHILRLAAQAAQATILHGCFHTFGGAGGVTGVLLLAESHISIHTWPEHAYAAIDVFMCGHHRIDAALQVLQDALPMARLHMRLIERGQTDFDGGSE